MLLLVLALATLAFVCHLAGDPERGLPLGREAVQRARQLGDDVLLGMSLMDCLLCEALIDPAGAGPLFTEAIACTQRSGDYLFANFVNNNAGVYALRAGDIPAARAYLQHAAEAMREIGGEIIGLPVNTGWVQRHDHDPDGARSSFAAALRTSRRIGDRSGIAYASLGLACLAADADDWRRAAVLHGVAQAFLGPTGNRGRSLKRATAETASPRCAPVSARSSSSRPIPGAWPSASARPSTSPPESPPSLTCWCDISAGSRRPMS